MKTIVMLLVVALASAVLARPSLPVDERTHHDGSSHSHTLPSSSEDDSASTEDVHLLPKPLVQIFPSSHKETSDTASTNTAEVRSRRSPKDDDKGKGRGGAEVDVRREDGRGTVVRGEARGTVYENDRVKVDAHGDWSKTVDGPGRAKPSYGGGFRVEW